jgi:membrane-associated phospholipid phosphatase
MMLRLWPPIAVAAMLLLGWAVGTGSTSVDDWFHQYHHSPAKWLLFFTDPRVLAGLLGGCLVVALYQRRWRLAAVTALSPPIAIALVQLLKRLFDRQSDGALAYPSGHTTTMVVVLGMAVLVARGAQWAVLTAVAYCLLGMIGQGVTYHYFTDTVGALLLGTAIVCVASLTSGRTPHQT